MQETEATMMTVVALEQRARGRVAHAVDLLVDRDSFSMKVSERGT
jgi:hypothetical protein